MVIKIEEIRKEGGLDVRELYKQEFVQSVLDDAEDEGLRTEHGLTLEAHLQKVGEGVLLNGKFTAQVVAPCKRCVVDVKLRLPTTFSLNLVPENLAKDLGVEGEGEDDGKGERSGSFRLEEADQDTFDGKRIDLDPIVREQLLLALPPYSLCGEDCRGLCSICGQNLNERQCGCDTRQVDPRLAALKDIKLN